LLNYKDISNSNNWEIVKKVNKGWSKDQKYYIQTRDKEELLLRLSDIKEYDRKREGYESLKRLKNMDFLVSRPINFGVCNKGQAVYSLLTWIAGEDAEIILPTFDDKEQYHLGVKAGEILRQIHSIHAPKEQPSWSEKFNKKIDRKISNYKSCSIQFEGADKMINYIEENRSLLLNRPQSFQHGDYHLGNMIITPAKELGIIDFNRWDYGDPWEEFNRIVWSVAKSPSFASGYINGYFENNVPDLFFKLLALYIANNQLGAISWAIPFGEEEVNTMLKQADEVLKCYDGFTTYIPDWYLKM